MENNIEEYARWLDDSKKHLSDEVITTYLNLEELLSKKEKLFVENHLASCKMCKEKFDHIVAEDKELDNAAEEDEKRPEEEVVDRVKIFTLGKVVKYAVAAVIVTGLVLVTYFSFFQEDRRVTTEKQKPEPVNDTTRNNPDSMSIPVFTKAEKETRQDTLTKATMKSFAVNDVLENFVNRNIRSETEIEIVQPDIDDTIKFPYTFKWNQKTFSGSNKLIIVDNQDKPLYQAEIGGKEITIDQKLASGLYYWKLESNGKLSAIGKFFVVK